MRDRGALRNEWEAIEDRIDRLTRDHLEPALYMARVAINVARWEATNGMTPLAVARDQRYSVITPGTSWGRPWGTTWFRIGPVRTPREWQSLRDPSRHRLELLVDLGFTRSRSGFQCEGLAYDDSGRALKAVSPMNSYIPIDASLEGREVFIEAASNPDFEIESLQFSPTPMGHPETAGDEPQYVLGDIELALLDLPVWELLQDFRALRGLAYEHARGDATLRATLLNSLQRSCDALDPDDIAGTADQARTELTRVLERPAGTSSHAIVAVGHAHIDSAWLWPLRETVRKCARTFTNVLHLMDEQREFVFVASSAQQFAWIKQFYPELFERVRERVREGRFVPVGGMWVESDTNMPGGEALVRQLVEGKEFFANEFDIDTPEVWLPDSFGYSAALPQLVALSGSRWFLTQKISWNQTNRMPHHTFLWEGIDGTRVFTHFPPVDTYGSDLSARDLLHAERNFSEKGRAHTSLVPYGWGDGGGGPTREMLASAERFSSLEGAPRVRLGTPREFFETAERELPDPSVWSGELYLESHRGTLTSQLRTKQGNRRNEHLLREAEYWATARTLLTGDPYPLQGLRESWHTLLVHQFHDILPGSAIAWVHREAEDAHEKLTAHLTTMISECITAIVGTGDRPLVANPSPFSREGVPGMGIDLASSSGTRPRVIDDAAGLTVTTDHLRLVLDPSGRIVSLVDAVTGRDSFADGGLGNVLAVHRDIPDRWDAWDIDEHHRRNVTELLACDPIRVQEHEAGLSLLVRRTTERSTIEQRIVIARDSPTIQIEHAIDWRERQKVLKLGFTFDLAADRSASETQFGHIYRPTHTNTSWEAAKFEFCAHRWIHVGEPGYGVAIANNSTYGHEVVRGLSEQGRPNTTVKLSLIRSPIFPDPHSDQGVHTLNVTLRAGASIADAIVDGYALNLPARQLRGDRTMAPLVSTGERNVVIESVKLAHDGSGDLIVRLYEAEGARTSSIVSVAVDVLEVAYTDLRELPIAGTPLLLEHGAIQLTLHPFQIVTLRFRLASNGNGS